MREVVKENINRELRKYGKPALPLDACERELQSDLKRQFRFLRGEDVDEGFGCEFKEFCENCFESRVQSCSKFLGKINELVKSINISKVTDINFLNGDSHNGGRPVQIKTEDGCYVVKRCDSRCYRIFSETLNSVLENIGKRHRAPVPRDIDDERWQVLPYLKSETEIESSDEVKDFGYLFGVNLAIGYALHLTDVHFENLIVSEKKPYIIDTECLFYNFYFNNLHQNPEYRILSTGIIAVNKGLSALYGGSSIVKQLGFYKDNAGNWGYSKINEKYNNRITRGGIFVDPLEYCADIVNGFSDAYENIVRARDEIIQIVQLYSGNGIQTRCLVRTTSHYKATIDMLFSPGREPHNYRVEKIIKRFVNSGSLLEQVSEKILVKEVSDMMKGDIPYFTVDESGEYLRHGDDGWEAKVGFVSFKDRIERSLGTLELDSLPLLRSLIEQNLANGYGA